MNDLEIIDGEFFLLRTPTMDLLHDSRADAIENLKEYGAGAGDDTDISVVKVNIDGGDWTIAEIPWQEIALELLSGGSDE